MGMVLGPTKRCVKIGGKQASTQAMTAILNSLKDDLVIFFSRMLMEAACTF
jgi:hypothetical protein